MKIKVNGKVVGEIEGDTYITKRVKAKHLMRIYDAWGISSTVIQKLKLSNVSRIVVISDDGMEYRTHMLNFLSNGITKEWGGDEQVFLPLKFWSEAIKGQQELF